MYTSNTDDIYATLTKILLPRFLSLFLSLSLSLSLSLAGVDEHHIIVAQLVILQRAVRHLDKL